jgi:GDP-L-fucose synthase
MPTNLYGPNDNFDMETSHVVPALIRKFIEAKQNNKSTVNVWGSGKPLREFLHTDDLAKAILICIEKYNDNQQINVGSGQEISIKDLANKISMVTGFKGHIDWDSKMPDGTPRKILDSSKINKLGWKPLISLDEGIRSTVEWYLENR